MHTIIDRRFDSLDEFVGALKSPYVNARNEAHDFDSWITRGWLCADRPHLTRRREMAREFEKPLFPQGVERIEALLSGIVVPAPRSIRRRMTRGDHGDELDIQRVWQGDLDNAWTRAQRQVAMSPSRILIQSSIGCNANDDNARVAWRGVAAIALCDALTAAGYTVCLRAVYRGCLPSKSGTREGLVNYDVAIKNAADPLDVHKAACLIASTLLFRGPVLDLTPRLAPFPISHGIGHTMKDREHEADASGFDMAFTAGHAVANQQTAQAWLNHTLAAIEQAHEVAA